MTPQDDLGPLLASLPPAVREALEAQDVQRLDAALRQLSREQAEEILWALAKAGVIARRSEAELDAEQALAYLPPAARAAVEAGDSAALKKALAELPAAQAETILKQLRQAGLIDEAPPPYPNAHHST